MKTDDLISLLASSAQPIERGVASRRFRLALGWGLFGSVLLMAIAFGVRPDIDEAIYHPLFWVKLLLPIAIAWFALIAAERLGRPGVRLKGVPIYIGGLLAGLWIAAVVSLFMTAPGQRALSIFGQTWKACLFNIVLLSVPVFVAAMWAMKGLAPTRPAIAGGAAGLLAGSCAAAIYALHCPELALPFIGIWYVLGALIPSLAGVLIGKRLLRW